MNKYEKLLKQWCDKLIELQITEIKNPLFYGGILCPSCAMIHGRIADAVYPFTLMYQKTGDRKYLDAAKRVVDWSEHNLLRADGGIYNDKCSGWKGISVFYATALGDTLTYHSECLDGETKEKWLNIFLRLAEFVYSFFDKNRRTNVNYYATICPVMAYAYKFTGDEKYKQKAFDRYNWIKNQFTENGLLFGEGPDKQTKKNCKYVDIGYNVEESLPAIASMGHILNDKEILKFAAEKYLAHIEFMLPDGAWDNSFGTRSNKWTYWGSRTSDGAQTGLCYLTDYGDIFAEAIERNFSCLEKCSKNGYLYGGMHYKEFGEEPCVHHSFCHAKALAVMIDTNFEYKTSVKLPREYEYGIKYFPEIHVNLISKGKFKATFSDNDAVDYFKTAPSGGALTILWNKDTGMLFSASAPNYNKAMNEPRNMQLSRINDETANCTLRIEKDEFLSQNDICATVETVENEKEIKVNTKGILRNIDYNGEIPFRLDYTFTENVLKITALCESDATLHIPVIATKSEKISINEDGFEICKNGKGVAFKTNGNFNYPKNSGYRDITLIGGFNTIPISADLKANTPFAFEIIL